MVIEKMYHAVRKFLFEILLFFFMSAILCLVLAFLILLYPYLLTLLVALGFFIMGAISVYLMIRVGAVFHDCHKIKDLLQK